MWQSARMDVRASSPGRVFFRSVSDIVNSNRNHNSNRRPISTTLNTSWHCVLRHSRGCLTGIVAGCGFLHLYRILAWSTQRNVKYYFWNMSGVSSAKKWHATLDQFALDPVNWNDDTESLWYTRRWTAQPWISDNLAIKRHLISSTGHANFNSEGWPLHQKLWLLLILIWVASLQWIFSATVCALDN